MTENKLFVAYSNMEGNKLSTIMHTKHYENDG